MNLRNIRHRLPRLNRKQRVVRNLALAALCLLLLEWMLAFPALSRRGLLRRLEHRYLLEGSELLFTSTAADYGFDEPHTLYARNEDLLLTMTYNWTPLGLRPWPGELRREEDGVCLVQQQWCATSYMAFGNLEDAASAELTVTLAGRVNKADYAAEDGDVPADANGLLEYRETYTAGESGRTRTASSSGWRNTMRGTAYWTAPGSPWWRCRRFHPSVPCCRRTPYCGCTTGRESCSMRRRYTI